MTFFVKFVSRSNEKSETQDLKNVDTFIAIIAGSPLSDTLVNLSLAMDRINIHDEEYFAKLGQMRVLKKIEIGKWGIDHEIKEEIKRDLCENLPHLKFVEDRQQENFFVPADPYAKHDDALAGFWETSCNQLSQNLC